MEKWCEVDGYDGKYMVSSEGRVKSVYANRSIHGKLTKIKRERELKGVDNGSGYLKVNLMNGTKRSRKSVFIHRLVAESFVPNPQGHNVVNHIDFNRYNNTASNLEWCTQKENMQHASVHMKKPRKNSKPTNTGEKYIRKRDGRYILSYKKTYRSYMTLEEAKVERSKLVDEYRTAE